MNYTVVVVGGILLTSTVYFFLPLVGAIRWFTGPVRTIDSLELCYKESLSEDMSGK